MTEDSVRNRSGDRMKEIIVRTQAELDALLASFDEYTVIVIKSDERIVVHGARENSIVG